MEEMVFADYWPLFATFGIAAAVWVMCRCILCGCWKRCKDGHHIIR